jgi:hypothetical protein
VGNIQILNPRILTLEKRRKIWQKLEREAGALRLSHAPSPCLFSNWRAVSIFIWWWDPPLASEREKNSLENNGKKGSNN